ncbi:bifunctional nuclease family protein [uncultured Cytophaga sp.]|uniref:bifunctional nuclease family protein n=1 Tax=uncultured Cytophaga sp. TaxID=160238 RepID=UPI00262924F7|nr:bifunctional nuclease family protein [uncultured Cytophaga sp.]
MEKIRLEIIGLSSSQSQTGSFALVLGEVNGNRRLPIIIGMFEAQAIAIEIEKVIPNRPMTHDLFKSFALSFHFVVEEIVISDLKEGVFFAKIICSDGIKTIEIDARPSDAIAIGLRFDVPIFSYETIMSEAGIVLNDDMEDEIGDDDEELEEAAVGSLKPDLSSSGKEDQMKNMSLDQLQSMLDEAIDNEDYEKAARVRDEINKRN